MRHYTLNLSDISDRDALHARLSGALMLPDYYGRNLDALKDCLTDIQTDFEIVINGYDIMHKAMEMYAEAFRNVLYEISKENKHIKITYNS